MEAGRAYTVLIQSRSRPLAEPLTVTPVPDSYCLYLTAIIHT